MNSLLKPKVEEKIAKPVNVRLVEGEHAVLARLSMFTKRSMSELATEAVRRALAAVEKDEKFKEFCDGQVAATPIRQPRAKKVTAVVA